MFPMAEFRAAIVAWRLEGVDTMMESFAISFIPLLMRIIFPDMFALLVTKQ